MYTWINHVIVIGRASTPAHDFYFFEGCHGYGFALHAACTRELRESDVFALSCAWHCLSAGSSQDGADADEAFLKWAGPAEFQESPLSRRCGSYIISGLLLWVACTACMVCCERTPVYVLDSACVD